MILQGKNIRLRPMKEDEIPLFYKWATSSDATPYWYGDLYGTKIPSLEEFLDDWKPYYFDGSQPNKGRCFVILIKDEAIGQVNYNEINKRDSSVELDIIIANDLHKGKGYGSDALKTLANYLFNNMNTKKCFIDVAEKNPRAKRAYEKAGFKMTKTFSKKGIKWNHMEFPIENSD